MSHMINYRFRNHGSVGISDQRTHRGQTHFCREDELPLLSGDGKGILVCDQIISSTIGTIKVSESVHQELS
jgi:hypothetical protein